MDASGQELLTGPGFAFQQYDAIVLCDCIDDLQHLLKKRTWSDKGLLLKTLRQR
jgi:hypothetical protein